LGLLERSSSDRAVRRGYDEGRLPSQIPPVEAPPQALFDAADVGLPLVPPETPRAASIAGAAGAPPPPPRARAAARREERGVVLFYDAASQRLRMEIGYGLEEYFPDAFVSYFIDAHARAFFAAGDPTLGLGFGLRLLHRRIREAALDRRFDPTMLARLG